MVQVQRFQSQSRFSAVLRFAPLTFEARLPIDAQRIVESQTYTREVMMANQEKVRGISVMPTKEPSKEVQSLVFKSTPDAPNTTTTVYRWEPCYRAPRYI